MPRPIVRVGLDAETLPYVSWDKPPVHKHAICFAWGTEDNIEYIESRDQRPGRFKNTDLIRLRSAIAEPTTVVVGHNALRYDLPLLNGVLLANDIPPLPEVRCQDTLNTVKNGYAYRNSLRAQCKRYGVALKEDSPDWDEILLGNKLEWAKMRAYNMADVVSTLQLERALADAGVPVPIQVWKPRKTR